MPEFLSQPGDAMNAKSSGVGVYIGDGLRRYGFGDNHPFGVDRLDAFWNEALRTDLAKQVQVLEPVACDDDELTRFHDSDYVEFLKQMSSIGVGYLDGGDTPAVSGIYEASSFVVGSDLDALNRIFKGELSRIFIPIAGLHHATRTQAAGFCTVSDLGVLIETLREKFNVKRVAYVDIDAHHGDGVFYAFESDPDVIVADIHEDGRFLYPGTGFANETGKGEATGTKLNIPVMPNSADDVFYESWGRVEEFVRSFKPEMIILQAGADSIDGDPITHMRFTPQAHGHAARQLCRLAEEFCNGRFIATGGGGYNRRNIALGWCEVLKAMVETA